MQDKQRPPTIDALRALLAVADSGGVSQAARKLGISQPVVSRKVAIFTDANRCGAVLLKREGNRLTLTESAHAVLPAIRRLVSEYDGMLSYLGGKSTAPQVIRIGSGIFAAESYLPTALARLRDIFDACQVTTHVCRGRRRIMDTASGHFDLALVTHAPEQIKQILAEEFGSEDLLAIERLGHHALGLIARKQSPWGDELHQRSENRPVPINAIAQMELVGPDRNSGIRRRLASLFPNEELYFVVEGGGWTTAKECARRGLGVAVLPLATLTSRDKKEFVIRKLAREFVIRDYLIYRPGETTSELQRVKEELKKTQTRFAEKVAESWR